MKYKTVVSLLSGGLDSTVVTCQAFREAEQVKALSFDYGQRHSIELQSARDVVQHLHEVDRRAQRSLRVDHIIVPMGGLSAWGGSALTSDSIDVPKERNHAEMGNGIPVTYVPGRNTVFLAYAFSLAEAVGAEAIFLGVNALDYSGYPDCRPEYIDAMRHVARVGTRVGSEGKPFEIIAPLINLKKTHIIKLGHAVQAPMHLSWSCYDPQEGPPKSLDIPVPTVVPCGKCDSCKIRQRAFDDLGIDDPSIVHRNLTK